MTNNLELTYILGALSKSFFLMGSQWSKCYQYFPKNKELFVGIISVCVHVPSHVWLSVTAWTVAHQAPLSMGFSRQEYWSGLSFFSPGNLPDPRIKPTSLKSPTGGFRPGGFFPTVPPGNPGITYTLFISLNVDLEPWKC